MNTLPLQHTGVSGTTRGGNKFRRFAVGTSRALGSPMAFVLSVVCIILWAASGPVCHFSDSWQLIVNTATSIITFLMVFLIQNSQNREATAMQLKLDELIRAVDGARTNLVHLEELDDEELEKLQRQFMRLQTKLNAKSN